MKKRNYNQYKISIIIPVYNAELYLEECIQSILQQKHSNLEVILVDDGSSDSSLEIIKRQCAVDDRFKGVVILNHGAAYARNIGLNNVTGDFIMFLDNDDLLAPNAISKLCRKAIQCKAEIVVGNTLCFNSEEYYLYRPCIRQTGVVRTGLTYFASVLNTNQYTVMLYNYLYKSSFVEKYRLRFDSNIIHEDELWTPNALILAKRVIPTNIVHYYYRQRKNSLSNVILKEQWNNELTYITAKLMDIIQNTECNELQETLYKRINQIDTYIKARM